MKKLNFLSLSVVFAGSFLGAGFVSGQELWQFFGKFGLFGFLGLLISLALFFITGVFIISYVFESGCDDVSCMVVTANIPVLRALVGFLECLSMLCIFVVMTAAAGALLNSLFGIAEYIGSAIFAFIVFLFTIKGVGAMIRVFSFFVPMLVVFTVILSIYAVNTGDAFNFSKAKEDNVLLSNFVMSAVLYVAYGIVCSLGVMASYGKNVRGKKDIVCGILLGSLILAVIATGILFTFFLNRGIVYKQLPMLAYASKCGSFVKFLFAFLLVGAMLGTAISSIVATVYYISKKVKLFNLSNPFVILDICVFGWVCSLLGFRELVGTVYPLFGYFGIFAIIAIIVNYILFKRKKNK